jgi:hypothetical protein
MIEAQSLVYRSVRRVRVVFTNTLAGGAFSPAWFTMTSTDSLGAAPGVRAALVVTDSPTTVELALESDLADGAGYLLTVAAGVPASDASTTAAPTELPLRTPAMARTSSAARSLTDDAVDSLYGVDLAFADGDFVEGVDGDMQTVRGVENVQSALERRALSEGLAWVADYGAKLRQYVDGPAAGDSSVTAALRAALLDQARTDERVLSASTKQTAIANAVSEQRFEVKATLIGGKTVSTSVPVKRI